MVTIAHRHADEYIQSPNPSHQLFLMFGTDAGLASERARALLHAASGGAEASRRTQSYSGDAIASDPSVLLDEIRSIGLFDLTPAPIRISLGARNLIPALELALKGGPFEARIVVEAGPLRPTAPIRKWFDSQSAAAAIECYSDQAKDLRRLIDQQISSSGASIEAEAVDMLLSILGEDRLISRTELEKLCLYTNCRRAITSQDVADLLVNSIGLAGGDIVLECLLGNVDSVVESLSATAMRASECSAILNNLPRYMLAIHLARAQLAAGVHREGVLQGLIRSISGAKKRPARSEDLLGHYGNDGVDLVESAYVLAGETRRNSLLADAKLSRSLIALSKAHRNRRAKRQRAH
jgi:DNA polymerase III subunit delta